MISLIELLPDNFRLPLGKNPSVLCVHASEPKYLVFGHDATAPAYVIQTGEVDVIEQTHTQMQQLHRLLPGRVPEPLLFIRRQLNESLLVQRGLKGIPWFALRDKIKSSEDWYKISEISLLSLQDFHLACANHAIWNKQIEMGNLFDTIRYSYESFAGPAEKQEAIAMARLRSSLDEIAPIICFRQHGDFCVNNLLIRQQDAGIIDFEQFGRVFLPFHDEFLLFDSLLSIHPKRDQHTAQALWNRILSVSQYKDKIGKRTIDALLIMHLMWWITEAQGNELRNARARMYQHTLRKTLLAISNGQTCVPDIAMVLDTN